MAVPSRIDAESIDAAVRDDTDADEHQHRRRKPAPHLIFKREPHFFALVLMFPHCDMRRS
jgi:hypothetical protein